MHQLASEHHVIIGQMTHELEAVGVGSSHHFVVVTILPPEYPVPAAG